MKQFARSVIVAILGWQVRRLRRKHIFKVIVVAGSIGKTSTKFAIAQLLGETGRVRFQAGNYNDLVSVPLVFFGQPMPSLFNPVAWAKTIARNERQIHRPYPYDVVVAEVGIDGPGQMAAFGRYLQADIAVLTAITPEHMEFFADLEAVAAEELQIQTCADLVLANADLVKTRYLQQLRHCKTYSLHEPAAYKISRFSFRAKGVTLSLQRGGETFISASHSSLSEPHLYTLAAATGVADLVGMSRQAITSGLARIKPVSGRMQLLAGVQASTIIDDTYNASPEAVKAALETLYRLAAPHKIALLGNMNELGAYSAAAHEDAGRLCDPQQLDEVITIGPDANTHLARAARTAGCKVTSFTSPYAAGSYLRKTIRPHSIILVKGSQNRVFAEEAVKYLLADRRDEAKLVRQSPAWLKIKHRQFKTS